MTETLVLIDYGSGNLHSAAKAVERAAADNGIPLTLLVSADPAHLARADRIILPGVGAFGDCLAGLKAIDGLFAALTDAVLQRARPFLGICVGMQMMASEGMEYGRHEGLDWIPGRVDKIAPKDPALKIPHMGWNDLSLTAAGRTHPVLAGLDGQQFYFVHSYELACAQPGHILAVTDYGGPVAAVVGRDNMIGTQFHPEKSQQAGLALIGNFLKWRP